MKRVFLFVLTNIAVLVMMMLVYHLACSFLDIDMRHLSAHGINYASLAVFSLVFGMLGAVVSLLMSKCIAKWSVGAVVVDGSENAQTAWLVNTIGQLAQQAGLQTPEVAIYSGPANAFATGAFRNSALIAVSDSIMAQMTKSELRAVLGHEMAHIKNGDMVTLTLVQGVLNAFVIFISRLIAYLSSYANGNRRRDDGMIFFLVYYVCQIVFGFVASLIVFWFSRRREYAADAGSVMLTGSRGDMIAALERLSNLKSGVLPDSLKAMGISGKNADSIFSTHPSLENRIAALRNAQFDAGMR